MGNTGESKRKQVPWRTCVAVVSGSAAFHSPTVSAISASSSSSRLMSHTVVVPSAEQRASTFSSSGAHSMPVACGGD